MKWIEIREIETNNEILAPQIYWEVDRETSTQWIEISSEVNKELNDFLSSFTEFMWMKRDTFYRVDAYFNEEKLYILDVNASFVDWWGNALNFARATEQEVSQILYDIMPRKFYLWEEIYRPEFELCLNELRNLDIEAEEVKNYFLNIWENQRNKTYAYWSFDRNENLFPYDWIRLDNKMNLALFSKIWKWQNVVIPSITLPSECSWQDLPKDVFLKMTWKNDINKSNLWKVKEWKPRKWWLAAEEWDNWKIIAQEKIKPMKNSNWENLQAIIMAGWNVEKWDWIQSIAWYVQASTKNIINDNSTQSPLVINN